MSSTATQRSLLLALSGVSLAALFLWYLQSKKGRKSPSIKDIEKKKVADEVDSRQKERALTTTVRESLPEKKEEKVIEEPAESQPAPPAVIPTIESLAGQPEMTTAPETGQVSQVDSSPVPMVNGIAKEADEENVTQLKAGITYAEAAKEDHTSVEESENQTKKNPTQSEESAEETADLHQQLVLDVSHQAEPEAFSWSDEMERSYEESRKKEEEERQQNEGSGGNGSGDYTTSDSPGLASQNSEVSSQDSGRATGGLASSLSPMDEAGDVLPMYEFEIPNTLVGLIIGIKGKTIKELSTRTDVRMLIRQHHTPEKVDTHQICQVRGKREQINRCLQMLRRRFPPARFPELNLQPVLPPPLPNNLFDALASQPSWLTLPDAIPCEVVCSSVIDPGHFFLQQPTHPSFSSLSHLDMYMIRLYSQGTDIPDLPKPCQTGLLCAAPVLGAWFRAVTVSYYAETDEVMLRFVDYGGYTRLPRSELRQIRTDLMSLPFQAIECYLAHVQPIDGTWQWGEAAFAHFQKLCMGKVMNATVVGFNVSDKVPMVELTVLDEENKPIRVDKDLMENGFAKASDPSKLQKVAASKSRTLSTHSTAPVIAAV
ncbi:unnamed protein product [Cylicocyclus nassatus]|uniref:Tudor domain-containing protein n=1 Tax=Cylicocyclus nassatus TaxID=53992 RepID=A0AA36M513_CYLNA|nr:unnamed protein product [Cylicocyclus nassatus]